MQLRKLCKNIKEKKFSDQNALKEIFMILQEVDVTELHSYDDELQLRETLTKYTKLNRALSFEAILDLCEPIKKTEIAHFNESIHTQLKNPYIIDLLTVEDHIRNESIDLNTEINLYILMMELLTVKRVSQYSQQDDSSVLQHAIEADQPQMIKAFITNDELNLAFLNYYHENFLFLAAMYNSIQVFKLMYEYGLNLNDTNSFGETVLHKSLYSNAHEVTHFILTQPIKVNVADIDGNTPLHIAASKNLEITQLLIEKGAKINVLNKHKESPLMYAIRYKQPEIVALLLEKGANCHPDIVNYLVVFDAIDFLPILPFEPDFSKKLSHGNTYLHIAAQNNSLKFGQFLIEKGLSINEQNNDLVAPIHYSSYHNFMEFTELLINHQANVKIKDVDHYTPLHQGVLNLNLDMTRLLISKGADVNVKYRNNYTPLHFALHHKNEALIQLLIESGADVNIKFENDFTPLHYTTGNNKLELTKLFIEHGFNVNVKGKIIPPLNNAIYFKNEEIAMLLVNHGIEMDLPNEDGDTPLMLAIKNDLFNLALLFIEKGVSLTTQNKKGETPSSLSIEKSDSLVNAIETKLLEHVTVKSS